MIILSVLLFTSICYTIYLLWLISDANEIIDDQDKQIEMLQNMFLDQNDSVLDLLEALEDAGVEITEAERGLN